MVVIEFVRKGNGRAGHGNHVGCEDTKLRA